MTALKRIEREPLWDLAHAQLRHALLAGRFEPGTVLTLVLRGLPVSKAEFDPAAPHGIKA